ncbi:MAG: TIGR02996 domain-containing protein [Gemmataceae bacterium]
MDDKALLTAILADPDDDLPRLAYADWLDEHGDDGRAEFVRGQVELARTDWAEDRHAQLLARGRELEDRHRADWLAGAPSGVVIGQFERGFPVRVGPPLWIHPAGLTPVHSTRWGRSMRLPCGSSPKPAGRRLASLQRFPQQSLYPARRQPSGRLAGWPSLAGFTTLDLGGGGLAEGKATSSPASRPWPARRLSGADDTSPFRAAARRGRGDQPGRSPSTSAGCGRWTCSQRAASTTGRRCSWRRRWPTAPEEVDGIDLETAGAWLRPAGLPAAVAGRGG